MTLKSINRIGRKKGAVGDMTFTGRVSALYSLECFGDHLNSKIVRQYNTTTITTTPI